MAEVVDLERGGEGLAAEDLIDALDVAALIHRGDGGQTRVRTGDHLGSSVRI